MSLPPGCYIWRCNRLDHLWRRKLILDTSQIKTKRIIGYYTATSTTFVICIIKTVDLLINMFNEYVLDHKRYITTEMPNKVIQFWSPYSVPHILYNISQQLVLPPIICQLRISFSKQMVGWPYYLFGQRLCSYPLPIVLVPTYSSHALKIVHVVLVYPNGGQCPYSNLGFHATCIGSSGFKFLY